MIAVAPLRDEDAEEARAVRNRVHAYDRLGPVEFAEMRATPGRLDLVARVDERIVATAGCAPDRWSPASDAAFAGAAVLPEFRRRGIGTQLAAEVSRHARSLGKHGLLVGIWEDSADGLSFARNRGFHEVARMQQVVLVLDELQEPPPPDVPPGVMLERIADDDTARQEIYELAREVELDVPSVSGAEPAVPPFEEWRRRSFRTALLEHSFVARAGGELVGYAILSASGDPSVAHHEMTGVHRAWRGRGLATALKAAQIASAKRAGIRELGALNEEGNAPMRAVNARLGYRPRPAKLSLRGPLLL